MCGRTLPENDLGLDKFAKRIKSVKNFQTGYWTERAKGRVGNQLNINTTISFTSFLEKIQLESTN